MYVSSQIFVFVLITSMGFEVLREVVMRSSIFMDIAPLNLLKVNKQLGGI
jgi:hypothetical protein